MTTHRVPTDLGRRDPTCFGKRSHFPMASFDKDTEEKRAVDRCRAILSKIDGVRVVLRRRRR
ncbi:MAG: hypothetical protein J6B09_06490 [Clostridia bacterium]|nr:hypothetical protein [Clostridia bacterium]MBQ8717114.1 hypothetical protein [Clostridia bacterium]